MKTIFLYCGTLASTGYIYQKETASPFFFADKRILYPDVFQLSDIFLYSAHFALSGSLYDLPGHPNFAQSMEKVLSREHRVDYDSVFWVCPQLFRFPDAVEKFAAYFHAMFPEYSLRLILALARQDLEIEALHAFLSLFSQHFSFDCIPNLRKKLKEYPVYKAALTAIFGKDALCVGVAGPDCTASDSGVRNLLSAAGFHSTISFPENSAAPYHFHELPAEFLAFVRIANKLIKSDTGTVTAIPWGSQISHFTKASGYISGAHSLFSPAQRREILSGYAPSNAALAKQLGMPELFPVPGPEPDWEPFLCLTAKAAYAVAARLDRGFALERLAEFDALPVRYMTREQRIIRQALHDALDPPSSVPLLHPRAEPKLSVLTLAYNHAKFIAKNIEGVLAQQIDFPMQHIIADDGSDDGTQDIILEYAAKHPHIVPVFRKDRKKTPWNNVRALFDMCRTEYAAVCDGDDYFTDPAKLQTQVDFLDEHEDCAVCFHVVRVTYEDAPERDRLYPPVEELPRGVRPFYYLSDLIKCNLIQTNSVMYRWRFKDGLPDWFRFDLCPGDWYWHLLHAEKGKIGFINKIMSVYHRHAQGVYYLSEIDRLKHHHQKGMKMLETYDAVNRHFNGRFASILGDLASGVIADWLMYRETEDANPLLEAAMDRFPHFTEHFLRKLERMRAASSK